MKVFTVLALCAVVFFAVAYSSPTEREDEVIEQDDEESALIQEKLLRYLMAMDQADEQAAESQRASPGMATSQWRWRWRRRRRPRSWHSSSTTLG